MVSCFFTRLSAPISTCPPLRHRIAIAAAAVVVVVDTDRLVLLFKLRELVQAFLCGRLRAQRDHKRTTPRQVAHLSGGNDADAQQLVLFGAVQKLLPATAALSAGAARRGVVPASGAARRL